MSNEMNGSVGAPDRSFLSGPTLFLRGVEKSDAANEAFWRPVPWPRSPELAEEKIAAERVEAAAGNAYTLIACRNSDELIVGSVMTWTEDWQWICARAFVSPVVDPGSRDAIEAEMLTIVLPWLTEERGAIAALTEIAAGADAERVLPAMGAKFCYRQREALLVNGSRRDQLGFQLLNKEALRLFGEPRIDPEEPIEREVRSAAPRTWSVVSVPPDGAFAIGERVYLRAIREDDAPALAKAALAETESSHDPRWPRSALISVNRYKQSTDTNLPVNISFAIVRRDTDEIIGTNDLQDLDLINRTAETGSELVRPEYRSKGYGTEAKHLLLSYAFDRLGLHMVRSSVWEVNPRSAAALRKQGYRFAGCVPWRGLHHGAPSGDWVFDLLASEWRAARR